MAKGKKNLGEMSTAELGLLFPVNIVNYRKEWPVLYSEEERRIFEAIGEDYIIIVEHIGSTAVPGLGAKPTIDILLEVRRDTPDEHIKDRMALAGYEFISKPENPPPHMMFAKGYSAEGITGNTFHVHARYPGNREEVVFRDYLVKHGEVADEYLELKKKLALEFRNDREKYTEAKTGFIKSVLARAYGQKEQSESF
ncbi:MAG: GrpB family protein [Bacteroidales bacterium]